MCTQPDERRLWQFLEAVEGWRFTGMGWMVCGPGEGDHPMDSAQLPHYVAGRPRLMEKYNKWDQKRQRPQGQAAEDGERGAAQQGQGMDENGEEGEPLAPPEVQQPLEKAGAAASFPEMEKPNSAPSSSRPSSTAVGECDGAAVDDVAEGAGKEAAVMGPFIEANAAPASSPPAPPAAAAASASSSASSATTPGSPPKPQDQAQVTESETLQAEGGADRHPQPQQHGGGQEEVGVERIAEGGAGGSGAMEAEAAPAARMEGKGVSEADDKGQTQRDKDKEAATMAETSTAAGAAGREEGQASPSPVGGGDAGVAGGDATAAAAGGGAAAAESDRADGGVKGDGGAKGSPRPAQRGPAAGPCLCPRDTEGESLHKTVQVERRCWPGSNKPGGVARIVKKYMVEEEVYGETVENTYYDVKYLLGGSEKRVKETFISCTPNETEARQAAPRDIFTVEMPEPTRRQRSAPPKPAPARTSPLSSSVDANSTGASSSSSSSSSASAKAKKVKAEREAAAKKTAAKARRSELTEGGDGGADARAEKKSKKRTRAAGGGAEGSAKRRDGGGAKKGSSSKASKENELEVPPVRKEERHAITDLSVVAEVQKAPDAPLSAGRMGAFQQALHSLFRQSSNDTVPVAKLEADINAQRSPEATRFDAGEIKAALKYLEEVESKVMLDGGMIYRI